MTPPLVPMVPAPPAGYAPVAADMTAWITTPFSFLASTTVFRGELHAATSWGANSWTLAPLDTVLEDPWGGWNPVNSSWLCPAGCSGLYEVTMTATSTSPGTTTDQLSPTLWVDGVLYATASAGWGVNGHGSGSCGQVLLPLIGGVDYVQLWTFSTAATTAPGVAGQYPAMEIAWIST